MKINNIPTILSIENTTSLCSICVNKNRKIFYKENYKKKTILNLYYK